MGGIEIVSEMTKETVDSFLTNNDDCYFTIFGFTDYLIRKHSLWNEKEGMLDVRKLAMKENIVIKDLSMKVDKPIIKDEILGIYKGFSDDESEKTIYVNSNVSESFKRYIIAHELAHYYMKDKKVAKVAYCVNMLLPKSRIESLCDLFSSFLLMPFEKVLLLWRKFKEDYIAKGSDPMDMYDWIKYLSCHFGVTEYHAIIMYQDIRALGGVLYTKYNSPTTKKSAETLQIPDLEQYKEFFKGME